MASREITLWLDERWYDALRRHLRNESVEDRLEEYLDEMINGLPEREYESISRQIYEERIQLEREQEAARRFSVFHITEHGEENTILVDREVDMLNTAKRLRDYLRREEDAPPNRFRGMFAAKEITPEEFNQYVLERLDNTGRVAGAFEIDLDKGLFSALHIMDGWKVFRVKDVCTAAYHACRKERASWDEKWERLLDKLSGKEITRIPPGPVEAIGARRPRPEEISFTDEMEEMDGRLNFVLDCDFNVDEVFGTNVETTENDDWINVYANYDMKTHQVCDRLEITLCLADGSEQELFYRLNPDEMAALAGKMERCC